MHDHSRFFVDDGKKLVFVKDFKRNVFGLDCLDQGFDKLDFNFFAAAQLVGRFRLFFVDQTIARIDQFLQARARPIVNFLGEKRIESFSGVRLGGLKI